MSFSELEKEKHLVLLVPNDQPYFLIHSAFSHPLLTLTGLAFSSFPTLMLVVADLTSNSSWLCSTSEVLCFLIWKTWPHKVHAFVPTFFFLSEMYNLPIFFRQTLPVYRSPV